MILGECNMNLHNWTSEGMNDSSAGDAFAGGQDLSGNEDWEHAPPDNGRQSPSRPRLHAAFASPYQQYLNSAQAGGDNRFSPHHATSHSYASYYTTAGMGPVDGPMERSHPGHPGHPSMEDDFKPSARLAMYSHSPMVVRPQVPGRHSISQDPFAGGIAYGLSNSDSVDEEEESHLSDKRAREETSIDTRYSHLDTFAHGMGGFDPSGYAMDYFPAPVPQPVLGYHFDDRLLPRYPPSVQTQVMSPTIQTQVMVPAVASPVAVPPPPLPTRRGSLRQSQKPTRKVEPRGLSLVSPPPPPPPPAVPVLAPVLLTQSGKPASQARFGPTPRELAQATTPRGQAALKVWYDRLNDLVDYKQRHGNCLVPQKCTTNPSLGIWVNKQRMEKKALDDENKSSMTADKVQALDQVGFVWGKRKGQASWDEKYQELEEYCAYAGNCNVPTKNAENPALGRWVSTQRSQYKQFLRNEKTHMTAERHRLLDKLAFTWDMME